MCFVWDNCENIMWTWKKFADKTNIHTNFAIEYVFGAPQPNELLIAHSRKVVYNRIDATAACVPILEMFVPRQTLQESRKSSFSIATTSKHESALRCLRFKLGPCVSVCAQRKWGAVPNAIATIHVALGAVRESIPIVSMYSFWMRRTVDRIAKRWGEMIAFGGSFEAHPDIHLRFTASVRGRACVWLWMHVWECVSGRRDHGHRRFRAPHLVHCVCLFRWVRAYGSRRQLSTRWHTAKAVKFWLPCHACYIQ